MAKPLGVGIIGANLQGSWGAMAHLPALAALEEVKAVAVATSRQETAEAAARQFGIAHAFSDPAALARHADVDIVAICVRVPAHRELVMLALEAGKHVYCEWPLGRDSAEAAKLHAAAQAAGVVHRVGLQARSAPVLAYARDLLAQGAIGTVRSAGFTHSVDWISAPFPSIAYLQDRASGAHFLSIPGGHSMDALCWLLGDFFRLVSVVKTGLRELSMAGTGERLLRSSADQILVAGELEGGVVASVRLSGASSPGTGIRLEINGDEGDLVISAAPGGRGIQMAELRLQRTIGLAELEDMEVPAAYFTAPAGLHNPALNVAQAYRHMVAAIRQGGPASPDFGDAVRLHRLLDRVEAAAK